MKAWLVSFRSLLGRSKVPFAVVAVTGRKSHVELLGARSRAQRSLWEEILTPLGQHAPSADVVQEWQAWFDDITTAGPVAVEESLELLKAKNPEIEVQPVHSGDASRDLRRFCRAQLTDAFQHLPRQEIVPAIAEATEAGGMRVYHYAKVQARGGPAFSWDWILELETKSGMRLALAKVVGARTTHSAQATVQRLAKVHEATLAAGATSVTIVLVVLDKSKWQLPKGFTKPSWLVIHRGTVNALGKVLRSALAA